MSKTYCILTHDYSFSHLKVRLSIVIVSVFLGLNPYCIKNYVLELPNDDQIQPERNVEKITAGKNIAKNFVTLV